MKTARVMTGLLIPLLFSLSLGCREEKPDSFARAQNIEGFAKLEKKLADLERNYYQVWGVEDNHGVLKVNDKLKLVPGHCDPTCNVHDWYVGVRNGVVETVWPVSARGRAY